MPAACQRDREAGRRLRRVRVVDGHEDAFERRARRPGGLLRTVAHDEHGHFRQAQHSVRGAAEEHPFQPASAVGPHDDRRRGAFPRVFDDRPDGRPVEQRGRGGRAGRLRARHRSFQDRVPAAVVLVEQLADVGVRRIGGRDRGDHRGVIDRGADEQFARAADRELDRELERALGRLRVVDRDDEARGPGGRPAQKRFGSKPPSIWIVVPVT